MWSWCRCRPVSYTHLDVYKRQGFQAQDYTSADKSVIIGETVRRTLFGDETGIGQTIRLGRVPFTVVGTLNSKGQGGFGQDQEDVVMVPLQTARRRLMGAMGLPCLLYTSRCV